MPTSSRRTWIAVCIVAAGILVASGIFFLMDPPQGKTQDTGPTHLRILAINDFHGHLLNGQKLDNRSAGSAPILATQMKAAIRDQKASVTILALLGGVIVIPKILNYSYNAVLF